MAKEKVKDAEVKEPLDIDKTIENLKKQVDDFAQQEEYSKAMKNKALGALEALSAIKNEESK